MEFPHANVARVLLNASTSYESLVDRAATAITIAANNMQNSIGIPYDNVSDQTYTEFHKKVLAMGYEGEKNRIDNHTVYKIRW